MDKTLERILSKVEKSNGCWNWTGAKTSLGYARVAYQGKNRRAHRVLWEILIGPIPVGHYLDHICRNSSCINPEHLRPVTPAQNCLENSLSLPAVNKQKQTCPNGHSYRLANRFIRGKFVTHRRCYECEYEARRRKKGT